MGKVVSGRKVRFGFIGCGRVSKHHFHAAEKNSDSLEMVAVCDVNKDLVLPVAQRFGARPVYDISEIAEMTDLDFVTVATPNGMHAENAIFLLEHGHNVVVEKPLAIHSQDGLRVLEVAKKNNREVFVIQQNRFNPPVQLLHNALMQKRFGKIYMIIINVLWHRGQEYYDKAPWHGTKTLDGGSFFTQASHHIDLMQWIADDEISTVFATLKTLARNIETEDCGSAILEWRGGTLGSINVTVLTNKDNIEGSVTVIGERGTVKIGGIALNEVIRWDFEDTRPEDATVKDSNYYPDNVYGDGHILYYRNIINVFKGLEKPMVDGYEGFKSLKILSAIHESAQKHSIVTF